MAIKTLEKNSVFNYFEILKNKFFKIVILNSIFFTVLTLCLILIMAISSLITSIFGTVSNVFDMLIALPLIILGPFTAAIIKVMRDFVRQEPGFFWQDFKGAFKSNFKQSIVIALFQYLLTWAIIIATQFYWQIAKESIFGTIGLGVTFFVAIALVVASYYLYMMTVTLKLSVKEIIKNSFIFTMLCFGKNILLTLILAVWLLIVGAFIMTAIASENALLYGLAICLLMTLAFGIAFYSVAFLTFPSIKKYILDPYYEQHEEESSKSVFSADNSDQKDLPEFVYHNGKMVHRSALSEEKVFSDNSDDE